MFSLLFTLFLLLLSFGKFTTSLRTPPSYALRISQSHSSHNSAPMSATTSIHLSLDDFSVTMYDAQLWASSVVEDKLTTVSPLSFLALYGSGLLTAFSPCVLGLLPLTMAYLGFDSLDSSNMTDSSKSTSNKDRVVKAIFYGIGLSSVLCSFGVFAALAGQAIEQSVVFSAVAGIVVAGITIAMGLKLLDLVDFSLPSFDSILQSSSQGEGQTKNQQLEAFLLGATTALIAEPCTSPVLASLLAVIAATGNPVSGAFFLFAYSLGYVTPVISCGVLSGSIKTLSGVASSTSWINEVFASLLIAFGTYKLLDVLV